jgi:hypothetical protein
VWWGCERGKRGVEWGGRGEERTENKKMKKAKMTEQRVMVNNEQE